MSNTVIKVENLSKQYRLGQVGTGTLSHDLNRWWARVRGKEDPFLKVGEVNDRATKGESEFVWALKDIGFEVKQGEVLGIIGKNGAGKSTLLKILSKVTGPTAGSVKAKGRIASLLEVGTGFHPELTGRENIYLNGTILGMTKREVSRKLDEIVDFAGVARYLDTPVKRYSSGMMVRLGFAVAAHLEPEILVVDEVLAVGDAEFQRKAVGKMQEVSQAGGRTVLFVSHNMASIQDLCTKCICLQNGTVAYSGETREVIQQYLSIDELDVLNHKKWHSEESAPGNHNMKLMEVAAKPLKGDILNTNSGLLLYFRISNKLEDTRLGFNLQILTQTNQLLFTLGYPFVQNGSKNGIYAIEVIIPEQLLNQGIYNTRIWFGSYGTTIMKLPDDIFSFEIMPAINRTGINPDKLPGLIMPKAEFHASFLG